MKLRIAPPLPQLQAHNPCGHWHVSDYVKQMSQARAPIPYNCWEVTGAIDGTQMLLVYTGRHRPNDLLFYHYDVATNVWTELLYEVDFLNSNWDGGASIRNTVRGFHNYSAIASGIQYVNESYTDLMMRTWINHNADILRKDWPGTREIHGRGKIAVTDAGVICVLVADTLNLRVEISTNFGALFATHLSLPYTTDTRDFRVLINSAGHIFVGILNYSANTLTVRRSIDNGLNWTVRSTLTTVAHPTTFEFSEFNGRFFAVVKGDSYRFYYSVDECAGWGSQTLRTDGVNFAANDLKLYNMAHQTDYYTEDYTDTSPLWVTVSDFLAELFTIDTRCTLRSYGDVIAYMQSECREVFPGQSICGLLLSGDFGASWKLVRSPLAYFKTYEDVLNRFDNPVWPFQKQETKF